MTLTIGIEVKLDEKGRLIIPRGFKGVEPGDEFLVSVGEGYLALTKTFGEPEDQFGLIKKVDDQRRINLGRIRKAIQLKPRGRAVVASGGDHLEIWTRNSWRRHFKSSGP
jgi:DNA-binding transcriptional regulator/RsmH inhibitor MraZ